MSVHSIEAQAEENGSKTRNTVSSSNLKKRSLARKTTRGGRHGVEEDPRKEDEDQDT